METNNNEITILAVKTCPEASTYTVHSCEGSSVNEIAFAVSVIIKVLIRDGYVRSKTQFDKLVRKYFTDEQYKEVTD